MEPKISDLQIAIFTQNLDFSNKLLIANSVFEGMPNTFIADPTMLPVPNDAPAEIPRIILKNTNSSYTMNIGLNRFDFHYHDRKMVDRMPTRDFEEIRTDVEQKIKLIAPTIKNKIGLKIIRLGFVPTFVRKSKNATNFIKDTFFNIEKVEEEVREINFSIRKRDKLNSLNVNIGINGNAFRRPNDRLDNKITIFTMDINTLSEEAHDLSIEQMLQFYSSAFDFVKENRKKLLI